MFMLNLINKCFVPLSNQQRHFFFPILSHFSKTKLMGNNNQQQESMESSQEQQQQQTFYKPNERSHFKPHLQGRLLPPLEKCQFTFQLLSDIHLEFRVPTTAESQKEKIPKQENLRKHVTEYFRFEKDEVLCDNLVLAGDIGLTSEENAMYEVLEEFLVYCCSIFKRVFYVLGNHEGYYSSLESADAKIRSLAANSIKIPNKNLIYMNKTVFDLPSTNVRILGCTLWSKPTAEGSRILNDFVKIKDFSYEKMVALHEEHVHWLLQESEKAQKENKNVLVITHHAPCKLLGCTPVENYEWETKNGICGTDLIPRVFSKATTPAISLMVFGHTHWSCSFEAGGIGIAANQVGYPNDIFKTIPNRVEYDKKRVYGL